MAQSTDQESLIDYLKSARQAAGLTQEELAARTGIPRTTIAKIESGFRNTTLRTLLNISRALNIDLELVKKVAQDTRSLTRPFEVLNTIEIYQDHILHNLHVFRELHPTKHIFPVLKSNAYGHGIQNIMKILLTEKLEYVAVDSYFEALQIWDVSPEQKVLLIGPTLPSNFEYMKLDRLALTVYDRDTITALGKLNKPVNVHIKLNTGLNRLGIKLSELENFVKHIKQYRNLTIEGISSHFADADSTDVEFTHKQQQKQQIALSTLRSLEITPRFIHLAATAGATLLQNDPTNAIRVGIGLYGYSPLSGNHPLYKKLANLKPALRLTSKLVNIISVKKGESIGYGRTYIADQDITIGALPIGYYDVLNRKLSNKGFVKYKNEMLPIVGRISMNITMVDLKDTNPLLWDEVEIISPNNEDANSIKSMAHLSETIPYETLVKIDSSTRRVVC